MISAKTISLALGASCLTSLAATGASAQGSEEVHSNEAHYRIFVGDHAEGVVRAFDVETGAEAGRFEVDQSPALTRSSSGRVVFAVQGDAGKVTAIGTGIAIEDHGDHGDLHVADATLLPTAIEGTTPAHLVEGSGRLALFDDGTGAVSLFTERAVIDNALEATVLQPGAAHHGLAAPMGDFLVVSVPADEADAARRGLRVFDASGEPVGDVVDCPGVHGQASSARVFAFGCRDGIVVATPGEMSGPPTLRHIPTAALGEGNVSTLKGGTAMQFFLGNYGPQAVVLIEPDAAEPFRKIELPTRRVDFALDPANPRNAFVLTEDGALHRLDVVSGAIAASETITEPYSMDGHWRDPRPRLAVAGEHVLLTDPREGVVRVVSAETLAEERTIAVEGTPYTIVAVGGSGATH